MRNRSTQNLRKKKAAIDTDRFHDDSGRMGTERHRNKPKEDLKK